ncbi:hypothetical protein E8E15_001093 [Penicillium rubens]|nr:hypothetical protein E8E15_001093 [Penicillium rubens]
MALANISGYPNVFDALGDRDDGYSHIPDGLERQGLIAFANHFGPIGDTGLIPLSYSPDESLQLRGGTLDTVGPFDLSQCPDSLRSPSAETGQNAKGNFSAASNNLASERKPARIRRQKPFM